MASTRPSRAKIKSRRTKLDNHSKEHERFKAVSSVRVLRKGPAAPIFKASIIPMARFLRE
jgi:hypothetical protein